MNTDDRPDHPLEALSALVDGELSRRERSAGAERLGSCATCRSLVQDLEVLRQAVATEPIPPAPADLAARIRARLEPRAASPGRVRGPLWGWLTPMPAAAAAAVVVAGLVWLAWREDRPMPAPSPHVAYRAPAAAMTEARTPDAAMPDAPAQDAAMPPPAATPPPESAPSIAPEAVPRGCAPRRPGRRACAAMKSSSVGPLPHVPTPCCEPLNPAMRTSRHEHRMTERRPRRRRLPHHPRGRLP